MTAARPETELLTAIVAATRERLGAAACSVALLDGDELEFRAADGMGADQVVGLRLPVGRGLAGYVVASGQALAVGDVRQDRRFDRQAAERTGYVPETILAVPVEDDDGPLGVLEVLDRRAGPHDMDMAAAAAGQVASVIRLAERSARTDAVLADPQLAELVELVRRFANAEPTARALAAALLRTLLDHQQ